MKKPVSYWVSQFLFLLAVGFILSGLRGGDSSIAIGGFIAFAILGYVIKKYSKKTTNN